MSGINWSQIGSNISAITTSLGNLGITGATATSIINSIGNASNPNLNDEISICKQILQFNGNPAIVAELSVKLATEVGIPQSAAAVALTLSQPGVDVVTKVMQIETLINSGG